MRKLGIILLLVAAPVIAFQNCSQSDVRIPSNEKPLFSEWTRGDGFRISLATENPTTVATAKPRVYAFFPTGHICSCELYVGGNEISGIYIISACGSVFQM